MYRGEKPFAQAPTIGELAKAIKKAIKIHGPDCDWFGWDTGSIYFVTASDDDEIQLEITNRERTI